MALLSAQNLRIAFADRRLFDGFSLQLERGDRFALIGPNGAGKTTLLRALVGQVATDEGVVAISQGVSVALHDQRPERSSLQLREFVAPDEPARIEQRMRELELAMGEGQDVLDEYGELQHELDAVGGHTWREQAERLLRGLGFEESQLDQSVATLSGGELTRAALARVLARRPDVLLLDEPTNHLDLVAIEWLAEYLDEIDAAVVIVTHDRWFAEVTCRSVVEISAGRARVFRGTLTEYRAQQAVEALTHEREVEKWQREAARLQRFVDKFSAGTRARQAQSKAKALERLKEHAPRLADHSARRVVRFELPPVGRTGRVMLQATGVEIGYTETLLTADEFVVERGETVVIAGRNGSGKTTLLRGLAHGAAAWQAGARPETAAGMERLQHPDSGIRCEELRLGHGVNVRYVSQHDTEVDDNLSLLGNVQKANPDLDKTSAMGVLGVFGLGGDAAERQASEMSGGERRRLVLATALTGAAALLMMDEPTNHLDLESREALEDALGAFEGSTLLITHDQALAEAVADRMLAVVDGSLVPVRSFDEARQLISGRPAPEPAQTHPAPAARTPTAASEPGRRRTRRRSQRTDRPKVRRPGTIEREIEELERDLAASEQRMLDPEIYSSKDRSADELDHQDALRRRIGRRYTELEAALDHYS